VRRFLSKLTSDFRKPGATRATRRAPRRASLAVEGLETRVVPATFKVTTLADTVNPFDGRLSLREAISAANAHPGPDTILLPAGTFTITRVGADCSVETLLMPRRPGA
jgi:CSLREA domain-containing protein